MELFKQAKHADRMKVTRRLTRKYLPGVDPAEGLNETSEFFVRQSARRIAVFGHWVRQGANAAKFVSVVSPVLRFWVVCIGNLGIWWYDEDFVFEAWIWFEGLRALRRRCWFLWFSAIRLFRPVGRISCSFRCQSKHRYSNIATYSKQSGVCIILE